ncbi:MAG TPA: tetratricopeptide repeat protein [Phycisphaerae bacterium]|nr:tetratricopeptide repeat protein [Phycisphaerae bacterium]
MSSSAGPPLETLKVGRPHPPLALWTIERDRPVSLDALRGQKVLLVHFASWCEASREPVSAWFERTRTHVAAKKVVVLGVDHEQHADRGRLFAQWRGLTGPILHDPLDLSLVTELPMVVAIDEEGVVRAIQPSLDKIEKTFINKKSKKKNIPKPEEAELPDPRVTRRTAEEAREPSASRAHADALVLSGLPPQIDEAIKVYREVIAIDPKEAWSLFRLGVAYRIRYEREERQPDDFQAAVDAWSQAVRFAPTNAIFRQRLQQYGPAIEDSRPSYEWILAARQDLARRGQQPIALENEPLAMELSAGPVRGSKNAAPTKGKHPSDHGGQMMIETTVVRAADAKHANKAEVHVTLRPSGVQWEDGKAPLRIWFEKSKSARPERAYLEFPKANPASGSEARTISFLVELTSKSKTPRGTLKGEAVYSFRSGDEVKTVRQEFKVSIGGKPEGTLAGTDAPTAANGGNDGARGR